MLPLPPARGFPERCFSRHRMAAPPQAAKNRPQIANPRGPCKRHGPDLNRRDCLMNRAAEGPPILLFLMSDDHDVKPKDIELDPIKRDKLTAFKDRAKNISADSKVHRVYATFDSLEDFARKVTQSVAALRRHLGPGQFGRIARVQGVMRPQPQGLLPLGIAGGKRRDVTPDVRTGGFCFCTGPGSGGVEIYGRRLD